jgi:hypothetical protein
MLLYAKGNRIGSGAEFRFAWKAALPLRLSLFARGSRNFAEPRASPFVWKEARLPGNKRLLDPGVARPLGSRPPGNRLAA